MTVRLRVTCEDVVREYAFDRGSISIGQGPFNDVVFARDDLARVHGELEVREDGLVFRARASSSPTSFFRDGECIETFDGESESVMHVHPGDLVRLGDTAPIELEILGLERNSKVDWSAHVMASQGEQAPSEETGRFLFRLVDRLANEPRLETFLR
jgi:pSer/pThr/pTyr-binding forkhead associated (FHA) protein